MLANPALALEPISLGALIDNGPAVEPAFVHPLQLCPRPDMRPEVRLLLAVVEDALENARLGWTDHRGREAMSWIDDDDMTWPFSFLRACDSLDIDAGSVRRLGREIYAGRAIYERANRVAGWRKADRRVTGRD